MHRLPWTASFRYHQRVLTTIHGIPQPAPERPGRAVPASSQWFTAARFALILSGLLLITFPSVLLGGQAFGYRDYGVLGYPFVFHFHESFWRGELPLWNPLSHCGTPFMAQWGTMVFYPFSLLHLLLPLPWSLGFFSLAHLFLGGLGTYVLAHRWTGNPFAATLAGLAYVFNGVTLSCLIWPNYSAALGWMPWVVNVSEQCFQRGRRWVVAAGLLASFQLLVGTPEIVLLTWLLIGPLLLLHWIRHPANRGRSLLRCAAVVLIASGLTAIQILPFLDLLAHSQRDASFASSKWPMPAWGWANLLVPLFRCFETPQGPYFQYTQQFMSSYYLGAGLLVLALWIVMVQRNGRVGILAGVFLFSLTMALGENGLFFAWSNEWFPLSSVARYPVKFMMLASFTVPLLAAFGVSHLDTATLSTSAKRLLILAGAAGVALMGLIVAFAFAYPFSTTYDQPNATLMNGLGRASFLALTLCLLIALQRVVRRGLLVRFAILLVIPVDILTHAPNQNPTLPPRTFAAGLWPMKNESLSPRPGHDRVFITPEAEARILRSPEADVEADFTAKRLALWSNLNLLERISKINGASTLQLKDQALLQRLIYSRLDAPPRGLLDFLGATLESSATNPTAWIPRALSHPLITAGQQPSFANATNTIAALMKPGFDPTAIVYLPPEAQSSISVTSMTSCRVLEQTFSPHRLTATVDAAAPSVVVIAQSFYHPWKASINGKKTHVWRANHAFQALVVPAGRHFVALHYKDTQLVAGALISATTLLACLVALVALKRNPPP